MRTSRRSQGSAIAFLDVMACGLGVAILLFLIVKHNIGSNEEESSRQETEENRVELLAELNEEKEQLARELELAAQRREIAQAKSREQQEKFDQFEAKQNEIIQLNQQIKSETIRKTVLEQEIVSIQPKQSDDVLEETRVGEENYLLGLEVKGRYIAILIDRSASMTDDLLIEVISRKVRSDADKKKGAKWKRTMRTATWLLNRLPEKSSVMVVVFNDSARKLNKGRWASGRDANALQSIADELDQLVPTGATNLEAALTELRNVSPAASDVYVITDGLPTKGSTSLKFRVKCKKNAKVVSGECREAFFQKSIRNASLPRSSTVNVILLPLEGDPEAAPNYWNWTSATGGLLLIPAPNWP